MIDIRFPIIVMYIHTVALLINWYFVNDICTSMQSKAESVRRTRDSTYMTEMRSIKLFSGCVGVYRDGLYI